MAAFNADILLNVVSTGAEREVKKLERNLDKVEQTTNDILAIDKKIIVEKKKLINLSGEQQVESKKRLKSLGLEKAELALQKRELNQIIRLEKSRKSAAVKTLASGAVVTANNEGSGSGAAAGLLAGLSFQKAFNKEQQKTAALAKDQIAITDQVVETIEKKSVAQEKLNDLVKRVPTLEGQVTRVLGQNNRIKKEGRKLTFDQEKQYIDAKEAVSANNKEIKKLTRETEKLTAQQEKYVDALEKGGKELTKADNQLKRRQRIASGGKAALAGAAFANVPGQDIFAAGAAGGLIGSAAGGIGAVPGAAIGATVAAVLKLGNAIGSLAAPSARAQAELSKLQIALRGVIGTDYEKGLAAITRASEDFNQSITDTTRQFTQLSAAGVANGNTVAEIENLYRGLAAATKATGGSAEDLNGVLRAATQVLSKNKVQAEELRGQIGDRLPGAFALFAEATGRTSQQLDKALKDGLVSADEFVTDFGNFIRNKYEPAAFLISQSPAEAGARLERNLKDLQKAIGPILVAIGAEFQNFAAESIKAITPLIEKLNEFLKLDRTGKNTRLADLEKNKIPEVESIIRDLAGRDRNARVPLPKIVAPAFSFDPRDNAGALRTVDDVFNLAGKRLVDFQARAKQLRGELFPDPVKPTTPVEDVLTEKPDPKVKSIKDILGEDWDQEVAIQTARDLLKITELQGQALVDGNLKRFEQLELQKENVRVLNEIEALDKAIIKAQARLVEFEKDDNLLAKAKAGIVDLQNEKLQRQLDLRIKLSSKGNDALKSDLEAAQAFGELVQNLDPLEKKANDTQRLLNDIGGRISTGIVDAITLAVTETDKLGDAFKDLTRDILEAIGRALILAAITQTFKALGGSDGVGLFSILSQSFGGGKADGGPVSPSKTYITGEEGPELFIPGVSGTIVPNDPFEAAVGALSGESTTSDAFDDNAEAIGVARSFAENNQSLTTTNNYMKAQGELQGQEALLNSVTMNNDVIQFETYQIGEMDVVTREEAIRIGQQSAKQAKAQVFSDLKNKPAARAQLGMR